MSASETFDSSERLPTSIPFLFEDYLELIDSLGRVVHPQKRGRIPDKSPKILSLLGIDAGCFFTNADCILKSFAFAVGAPEKLGDLAVARQSCYLHGVGQARLLYQSERKVA